MTISTDLLLGLNVDDKKLLCVQASSLLAKIAFCEQQSINNMGYMRKV